MIKLFPSAEESSAYQIDFQKEYEKGIRGVLFDVDNTLVPHGAPADHRAVALFAALRQMGMKTCIISNNKEPRVKPFAEAVGSPFICQAGKPSVRGYQQGMKLMGTEPKSTLFVGDQIFTDIYGANRASIRSYLVHPINPREEIQIVLKRYLEKPVLAAYHRTVRKDKVNR